MASGVPSWSTTAATNATADSTINWAEGMAPSAVNDSARAMMARIADWRDSLNGTNATTGGTTAYVLTSDQSFAALAAGLEVAFQINATNTGTSTLNVDSLGAKPLRSAANVEVVAGALKVGAVYRATYFTSNSGEWLLHDYTPTIIASDQVVTASIINDAVTYAKMQNVSATARALGRNTSGSGDVEEVTITQMLNWISSSARGDLIVRGASDWDRLAKGTAGYVLTSDGTDTAWAQPVIKKLSTQTASTSASLAFTSLIDSTYRKYVFELENILPATDDVQLIMEVSDDAGSSWKATNYLHTGWYTDNSASTYGTVPTTFISVTLAGANNGVGNDSGHGVSGTVELFAPSNSASRKNIAVRGVTYLRAGGGLISGSGGGFWNGGNAAITAVRFRFASGNITSGNIAMYGVV